MTAPVRDRLWSLVDELDGRLNPNAPRQFVTEQRTPLYLTGVSCDHSRSARRHNLGLLIQPGNSTHLDIPLYPVFGADNGCYSESKRGEIDIDRWLAWVETIVAPHAERCLFVNVPDVLYWFVDDNGKDYCVGDAKATLERGAPLLPLVRRLGLPSGLVAQDGLEELDVPWDDFDVLFIGGSDGFKLGPAAKELSGEARSRGKWVHVGRVNSWKRLSLIRDHHADSGDGTYLGFGPDENWPAVVEWLDQLDADAAHVQDIRHPWCSSIRVLPCRVNYQGRWRFRAEPLHEDLDPDDRRLWQQSGRSRFLRTFEIVEDPTLRRVLLELVDGEATETVVAAFCSSWCRIAQVDDWIGAGDLRWQTHATRREVPADNRCCRCSLPLYPTTTNEGLT